MPSYQDGRIYTIRCRTDETLIYVGSTTQPLAKRWGGHKIASRTEICQNRLIYKTINNNYENWYIELYEEYPCENKEQLNKREGEIIRLIGTLNILVAGRTRQEYREDNAEKIKEYYENNAEKLKLARQEYREDNAEKLKLYQQEYRENNAEKILERSKLYNEKNKDKNKEYKKERYEQNKGKILEKITCDCGCIITQGGLTKHLKTKKHIETLNPV
jgi:hypothetical protein